ncbi:MAG TPA: hypothetical protein VJQ55_16535 [Candidatus Binatia bacterium]|nr:hypothetical protein [Candidatus Binatia bacterium]
MENTKCVALVDKGQCGLDLVLVHQDTATETEIYECPLGHRKYVALGESAKRTCHTLTNGKECGLALILTDRNRETATDIYECPLGHRTYVQTETNDDGDEPSL